MDCEKFTAWLENRDIHDISEADRAHRHALECKGCATLLGCDEMLDDCIRTRLARVNVPEGFEQRIDLSLDRSGTRRGRRSLIGAFAVMCLALVMFFTIPQGENFTTMDELGGFVLADHLDHGGNTAIFDQVPGASVWFAEHLEERVDPPRLPKPGYEFAGARFCKLGHCQAVHMVYRYKGRLVSLFLMDEKEVGFHMENDRNYMLDLTGNEITFWKQGGKVFALVS